MLYLFEHGLGTCVDDFGNIIDLSMEAWGTAWQWWYGHGFYECYHWPIEEVAGHI